MAKDNVFAKLRDLPFHPACCLCGAIIRAPAADVLYLNRTRQPVCAPCARREKGSPR